MTDLLWAITSTIIRNTLQTSLKAVSKAVILPAGTTNAADMLGKCPLKNVSCSQVLCKRAQKLRALLANTTSGASSQGNITQMTDQHYEFDSRNKSLVKKGVGTCSGLLRTVQLVSEMETI